jgi:hypothetical protein
MNIIATIGNIINGAGGQKAFGFKTIKTIELNSNNPPPIPSQNHASITPITNNAKPTVTKGGGGDSSPPAKCAMTIKAISNAARLPMILATHLKIKKELLVSFPGPTMIYLLFYMEQQSIF